MSLRYWLLRNHHNFPVIFWRITHKKQKCGFISNIRNVSTSDYTVTYVPMYVSTEADIIKHDGVHITPIKHYKREITFDTFLHRLHNRVIIYSALLHR